MRERSTTALLLLLMVILVIPACVRRDQPCRFMQVPCMFEAPPFKLTVVDAGTGQPLADVHALAEWQMVGANGRPDGPLMALDAVSDSDGVVTFPGWGPIQGPATGIDIGRDPFITLFKTGYRAFLVNNQYDPPGEEQERVRRSAHDGVTYAMEPFHGAPEQWLEQLGRVAFGIAVPRSGEETHKFRSVYLNRLNRISAEGNKFTAKEHAPGGFFWHVDRELTRLQGREQ